MSVKNRRLTPLMYWCDVGRFGVAHVHGSFVFAISHGRSLTGKPRTKVVSFDKAGRFKACDDAMTAVGRARDVLQKDQAGATHRS